MANKYKTQRISNESVDNYLAVLKIIWDWFITCAILQKCDNALHANDDILGFDKYFFINENLDQTNPGNSNSFDKVLHGTIIYVRHLGWCSELQKHKDKDKWRINPTWNLKTWLEFSHVRRWNNFEEIFSSYH